VVSLSNHGVGIRGPSFDKLRTRTVYVVLGTVIPNLCSNPVVSLSNHGVGIRGPSFDKLRTRTVYVVLGAVRPVRTTEGIKPECRADAWIPAPTPGMKAFVPTNDV
jgi:hypothetical protein